MLVNKADMRIAIQDELIVHNLKAVFSARCRFYTFTAVAK